MNHLIRIHFTDGKSTDISTTDPKQADFLAEQLNIGANGTTRINTSDGNIVIVNRAQITHINISDAP